MLNVSESQFMTDITCTPEENESTFTIDALVRDDAGASFPREKQDPGNHCLRFLSVSGTYTDIKPLFQTLERIQ
jgi:hypothetical protein